MTSYKNISNTIWNVADLLRGSWKAHEYQDVILPFTVLKRLDAVLEPTKEKVITRFNELEGKVQDLGILRRVTGYEFYNTSPFTIKKLLDDPTHIERNIRNYVDGFSDNVKDIFKKFKFDAQLERLKGGDLLYLILKEFDKINLHPEQVPNDVIGLAFEDLIRRFAEQSNETAGEHYTPRDVVRVMTSLMFAGEEDSLKKRGVSITVYDPACGTGGMLTVGKDYILSNYNEKANVYLFGQELNSQTYAICKADMLLKGEDPERIKGGDAEHGKASTLSNDAHAEVQFDYVISNPPYGVEWKKDKVAVEKEFERGFSGRFGAGLPRISDGQLLFIQHAVSKFKSKIYGGSDAVIITNGSPLFTGDAGSGESNIRRWLVESDLVEAIIALPEQLFFNTPIPTYIWIFSNRKPKGRENKIRLIDARDRKASLRKNLGNKRYEISEEYLGIIINDYLDESKRNGHIKVFDSSEFGYREITIQRPLRLKFNITKENLERVKQHKDFLTDHPSKKKGEKGEKENKEWQELREMIFASLESLLGKTYLDREVFLSDLSKVFKKESIKVPTKYIKTIWKTLGEHDESAEICKDKDENVEANNDLKDTERVPFSEDIDVYFKREVAPYIPDAWIDRTVCDEKDGQVGKVGYEIPFAQYFYKHISPRDRHEIRNEMKVLEEEIQNLRKKLDNHISIIRSATTKGVNDFVKTKPSGVEWIGEIPVDWEVKPLKELFFSKKEVVGEKFDQYTLLRLSLNGVHPKVEGDSGKNPDKYESYQIFKTGDLVFCTFDYDVTPRTIGHVTEEGMMTGAYTRLIPKSEFNVKYFYYYYLALDMRKELLHLCTGLRNTLGKHIFWKLPNPYPPLEMQNQIVEYLDQKTGNIDQSLEKIKEQVKKMKEYRAVLTYDSVIGKIGK